MWYYFDSTCVSPVDVGASVFREVRMRKQETSIAKGEKKSRRKEHRSTALFSRSSAVCPTYGRPASGTERSFVSDYLHEFLTRRIQTTSIGVLCPKIFLQTVPSRFPRTSHRLSSFYSTTSESAIQIRRQRQPTPADFRVPDDGTNPRRFSGTWHYFDTFCGVLC